MSTPGEPVPQRIGDADRDRAVELLREHLAQGRLDQLEFDDRLGAALSARTAADLDPLFLDLPGPRPDRSVVPSPAFPSPPWQSQNARTPAAPSSAPLAGHGRHGGHGALALAAVSAAIWPITILLITFVLGWDDFWWLVFVPIVLSSVAGKEQKQKRERERIERDQRRLDERRRALGDQ